MEINELILIAFGGLLSLIAFFLKKENARIDRVCEKLREQEVSLARNGARDSERWEQTQRLLEDRRNDIIKLFERIDR
mgnify:CR=1 FL=1|tara:strand:+ start:1600 stop:1833 length:234 start_codon:yes stop_codon:yes gene_type:complete